MKHLFYLFFLLLVISCTDQKTSLSPVSLFTQTKFISHISIIQPELSQSPYNLALFDSLLVWSDPFGEYHFTLFDIRNNKQVLRFGNIGRGPGELMKGSTGKKYKNNYYASHDPNQKKVVLYSIPDLALGSAKHYLTTNFTDFGSFYNATPVNDSLFIGEIYLDESKYALVDHNSHLVFTGYAYPDDGKELSSNVKFFAYQGKFYQNPADQNLFVHIGSYGAILDFLKIENNEIVRKNLLSLIIPKYQPLNISGARGVILDDNCIIGNCDIAVTKDFIYMLYSDNILRNEHRIDNPRNSDTILVFDWDGQPIMCYKSDVKLYKICVSEDNKIMYGVIMNPEVALVKLNL